MGTGHVNAYRHVLRHRGRGRHRLHSSRQAWMIELRRSRVNGPQKSPVAARLKGWHASAPKFGWLVCPRSRRAACWLAESRHWLPVAVSVRCCGIWSLPEDRCVANCLADIRHFQFKSSRKGAVERISGRRVRSRGRVSVHAELRRKRPPRQARRCVVGQAAQSIEQQLGP